MKPHPETTANGLVIWGASGHARVVADIVRLRRDFYVAGFIDDVNLNRCGSEFCGSTILGGREQLVLLRDNGIKHLIFGFGDCKARLTLSLVAKDFGFDLATALHPGAIIASDVLIQPGSVVMAGAVINPGSVIGENVIINTASSVDHECIIDDGVHIGPGVHLGGGVRIGRGTWVGIGAVVKDKVEIGKSAIIGAGTVVLKDIPSRVVAFGVPARVMRSIEE